MINVISIDIWRQCHSNQFCIESLDAVILGGCASLYIRSNNSNLNTLSGRAQDVKVTAFTFECMHLNLTSQKK